MKKMKKPLLEQFWVKLLPSVHVLYIAPLIVAFITSVVGIITNGFVKFFTMIWEYLSSPHEVNGALIIFLVWGMVVGVVLLIVKLIQRFRKPAEIPTKGYYRYSPSRDFEDLLVTWSYWNNKENESRKVTIDPKSIKLFCPSCGQEKKISFRGYDADSDRLQQIRCDRCLILFTPQTTEDLFTEVKLEMQKKLDVHTGMFDSKGLLK